MASEWARKKAEELRESIWSAYEAACEAEGEDGCEHTPDGSPLICWSCRERKFELVAECVLADALDEARAEGEAALRQSHARLLAASAAVVAGIDQWNEGVQKVIGKQPAYRWGGLEELRAAVAEAEAL